MPIEPTPRSRVRRLPARGTHDPAVIHGILDEGLVAHVGFSHEGSPFVIPMGYARDGNRLLLPGSRASRLMRHLAAGAEVAVAVTLLDGLVLARSAFHHSMNYRSVVVLGRTSEVRDEPEKRRALDVLLERLVPGRLGHARESNAIELRATRVVTLPIREATAKTRGGPPVEDMALPHWAGLVPITTSFGPPVPAPDLGPGRETPDHARNYRRRPDAPGPVPPVDG